MRLTIFAVVALIALSVVAPLFSRAIPGAWTSSNLATGLMQAAVDAIIFSLIIQTVLDTRIAKQAEAAEQDSQRKRQDRLENLMGLLEEPLFTILHVFWGGAGADFVEAGVISDERLEGTIFDLNRRLLDPEVRLRLARANSRLGRLIWVEDFYEVRPLEEVFQIVDYLLHDWPIAAAEDEDEYEEFFDGSAQGFIKRIYKPSATEDVARRFGEWMYSWVADPGRVDLIRSILDWYWPGLNDRGETATPAVLSAPQATGGTASSPVP